MEIRVLEESDAAAWWRIRLESLASDPEAFGRAVEEHRETTVEAAARRFREAPEGNFQLGAFDENSLIGMVTFMRDPGLKERHKGRIFGVYVASAYRGKGLGRALLMALLEKAKRDPSLEQILLAVATCQKPARQLYLSLGFQKYGTEPNALKIGSSYVDEDYMILWIHDRSSHFPT